MRGDGWTTGEERDGGREGRGEGSVPGGPASFLPQPFVRPDPGFGAMEVVGVVAPEIFLAVGEYLRAGHVELAAGRGGG